MTYHSEPIITEVNPPNEEVYENDIDMPVTNDNKKRPSNYVVYRTRWIILSLFVLYSASNSMQWTQYAIIQDIVMDYYGVSGPAVSWTSMVYMITYVPLIFPASYLLDKMVSNFF